MNQESDGNLDNDALSRSLVQQLIEFSNRANSQCSTVLLRDSFERALGTIGWSGDFEGIWSDLVQQCKAAAGQKVDAELARQAPLLQAGELLAFYSRTSYLSDADIQKASAQLFEIARKILEIFDADRDGYISGTELTRLSENISTLSGVHHSVEDVLLQLDADHDGCISFDDLSRALAGPNHHAAPTSDAFVRADRGFSGARRRRRSEAELTMQVLLISILTIYPSIHLSIYLSIYPCIYPISVI